MQRLLWIVLAAALVVSVAMPQKNNPFLGRWDITVNNGKDTYPDWMEVKQTANGLTALIQPRGGGAGMATDVKVEGSHLTLTRVPGTTWDLTMQGDKFVGTEKEESKEPARLTGVRAPALNRPMPAAWKDPEPIFNGKDLTGWQPTGNDSHWVVRDGDLINDAKGANIKSTRKFQDFKLHIEFNCPDHGNSGVYLRGRYEIQVEYEPIDENDKFHSIGSIYSFIAPAVELPRTPGKWETFDATLVGRHLTLLRNGVKTIDNQEIPGPTGGALDSDESSPGPIYIQGDHTGGMRYRNITVQLPK